MMLEALANGEIIIFRDPEPVNNAFCLECGHEWPISVRTSWITKEKRAQQAQLRGTAAMRDEYIELKKIDTKKKHNPIRGFFGGFMDF